jgi:hypothetical protein
VARSPELPVASRLDFAAYVGQLAVPAVGLGALAAAATGRRRTLVALLAGYFGVSAGMAWDSLRWEREADGRPLSGGKRAARAGRVAVFNFVWLLVVPRALINLAWRGGRIRYEKMAHDGAAAAGWDKAD